MKVRALITIEGHVLTILILAVIINAETFFVASTVLYPHLGPENIGLLGCCGPSNSKGSVVPVEGNPFYI